jgi:hypothetical protein
MIFQLYLVELICNNKQVSAQVVYDSPLAPAKQKKKNAGSVINTGMDGTTTLFFCV